MLGDEQAAVGCDGDVDASLREIERLRRRGYRRSEQGGRDAGDDEETPQNSTFGTLRASSSTSKNGRALNPVAAATRLVGIICTALLYDSTVSL